MTTTATFTGSIPDIIQNREKLYQGDLIYYFRTILAKAQNLRNPYHNFRHMMHITWLCYQACTFYQDQLSAREMRNLLIAAMFHDFDHPGIRGNDDLNIERAVRGLEEYIALVDRLSVGKIKEIIRATEYPYSTPSESLPLCGKIIRDADAAQSLDVAWVQQTLFGLATEWGVSFEEILTREIAFHEKLQFETQWAQELFPHDVIAEKLRETKDFLALLRES